MAPPNDLAVPIRTCVGCRAKRPQTELFRCILAADGLAHVDRLGRGRGAWLCGVGCLELATRRNGFQRAWRTPGRLEPSTLAPLGRELAGRN